MKSLTRKSLAPTFPRGSVKKIMTLVFNAAKEKFSSLHFRAAIKCHVLPRREKGVLLTIVEKHCMSPPGEGGNRMGTLRRACRFCPLSALLSGSLIPPEHPQWPDGQTSKRLQFSYKISLSLSLLRKAFSPSGLLSSGIGKRKKVLETGVRVSQLGTYWIKNSLSPS